MDDTQTIPEFSSAAAVGRVTAMRRLKYLLTMLTLATWQMTVVALEYGTSVTYAFLFAAFAVSLAAVFVAMSALTPGEEETSTFGFGARFLWLGPPVLATVLSVATVVFQVSHLCNPFRGCSWHDAYVLHFSNFATVLISEICVFYAIILTASFIARLIETALRFRAGLASGCAALRSLLRSQYPKYSLTVAALIGWYALVIIFEFPLTAHLPLAIATAFLLAVLLLALPVPAAETDRSMSELGTTFLLVVAPALAALIAVHVGLFGLDSRRAGLFLHMQFIDLFGGRYDPVDLWPLSFLIPFVFFVTGLSLEFYAVILFAFLFVELMKNIERLLERKVE